MSAARTPSPASSTLRWNRIPAKPPRMAPTRLARATTTRAMMLAVLRVPASTGIRGKLFSCPRTSYLLPPTAPATATATAISTAHSQTATPCCAPLNRAIRPATYPPQKYATNRMTSSTTVPTTPTVFAFWAAWAAAWPTLVLFEMAIAVPAAATMAVSRTAIPVAVSQPYNAEPTLMPPYCAFSAARALCRSTRASVCGRSAEVLSRLSPCPSPCRRSMGSEPWLVLMISLLQLAPGPASRFGPQRWASDVNSQLYAPSSRRYPQKWAQNQALVCVETDDGPVSLGRTTHVGLDSPGRSTIWAQGIGAAHALLSQLVPGAPSAWDPFARVPHRLAPKAPRPWNVLASPATESGS